MLVIPAIDLMDGKVVRLSRGDFATRVVYSDDPPSFAASFLRAGARRVHVVDLDGARQGKLVNWKTLDQIFKHTKLKVDFGGGIKTTEDIERLLNAGADRSAPFPKLLISRTHVQAPQRTTAANDQFAGQCC